ncbi:hypothetical protein AB0F71_18580 [Kitasatospora sp. NPDC028055]|uniref:hypothetical protein n=1 Tax=Kitasatospora sp. NPDC028055 TaxID=3155653 RepID=UPI0033EB519D
MTDGARRAVPGRPTTGSGNLPLDPPLPPGWTRRRVGAIATVQPGRGASRARVPGTLTRRQLRCSNLGWGVLDLTKVATTELTREQARRYSLRLGDILLAEASGSVDRIGRPVLWNGEIEDCSFHSGLIRVRPVPGVDPRYLCHALSYDALRGEFGRRARGATGLKHLGSTAVREWRVPLPPPAEQRRVADALDGLLGRLDAGEAALDAARQGLPRLWDSVLNAVVSGRLTGDDITGGTVPGPATGPLLPIGEVAEVTAGLRTPKPADRGSAHPYLGVANVARESLTLGDVRQVTIPEHALDSVRRHLVEVGDLLVVRQNGSLERIGQAATWHGELAGTLYQNHLVRIRPGRRLLPRFLELVWNAPATRRRLQDQVRGTTGSLSVRLEDIRAVTIPVPALPVQDRLVRAAEVWREHVRTTGVRVDDARRSGPALRLSILAQGLSGRLTGHGAADGPTRPGGPTGFPETGYEQQEFDFR